MKKHSAAAATILIALAASSPSRADRLGAMLFEGAVVSGVIDGTAFSSDGSAAPGGGYPYFFYAQFIEDFTTKTLSSNFQLEQLDQTASGNYYQTIYNETWTGSDHALWGIHGLDSTNGIQAMGLTSPTSAMTVPGLNWTAPYVSSISDVTAISIPATAAGSFADNFALATMAFTPTYAYGAYVPEPSAWTLLIIGFGGLGGVLRRRRTLNSRIVPPSKMLRQPQLLPLVM